MVKQQFPSWFVILSYINSLQSSVADPVHFLLDPDPRIRFWKLGSGSSLKNSDPDPVLKIRIRIRVTQKDRIRIRNTADKNIPERRLNSEDKESPVSADRTWWLKYSIQKFNFDLVAKL